jgi:hypothetical protein
MHLPWQKYSFFNYFNELSIFGQDPFIENSEKDPTFDAYLHSFFRKKLKREFQGQCRELFSTKLSF